MGCWDEVSNSFSFFHVSRDDVSGDTTFTAELLHDIKMTPYHSDLKIMFEEISKIHESSADDCYDSESGSVLKIVILKLITIWLLSFLSIMKRETSKEIRDTHCQLD